MSVDPRGRLAGISTGAPLPPVLVASRVFKSRAEAFYAEARMHRHFHRNRQNGEWFDADPIKAKGVLKRIRPPTQFGPDAEEVRAAVNRVFG